MNWRSSAARDLIRAFRSSPPAPAVVVAIAADDDGYTVELSEDCAPDGRFEIGSPTKTMTGLVLASLVDDGIVAFDDEIDRWLDAGDNANITLRQLATHTSGSPGHTGGAPDPCAFLTAEVAEYELRKSPTRPRGVEWDYSNFGFQVLSLVLERAHSRANEQDRLPSHHGGSA